MNNWMSFKEVLDDLGVPRSTMDDWRARIATSDERDEMWPIIVAKYANYGGYQLKTGREIPLIFLEKV